MEERCPDFLPSGTRVRGSLVSSSRVFNQTQDGHRAGLSPRIRAGQRERLAAPVGSPPLSPHPRDSICSREKRREVTRIGSAFGVELGLQLLT